MMDTHDNRRHISPPPLPALPPSELARHGARVLDPDTAVQTPGAHLGTTVYLARRLLVRGLPGGSADRVIKTLQTWSDERGLRLFWRAAPRHAEAAEAWDRRDRERLDGTLHTAVDITPVGDEPASPPDAWDLLQRLRYDFRDDVELINQVALDHLMAAGGPAGGTTWGGVGGIWGGVGGIWGGVGGIWGGVGGIWGGVGGPAGPAGGGSGRTPVVWSAPDPRLTASAARHVPVVAVLDTGVGTHPWFASEGEGFSRYRGPGADPRVLARFDDPEAEFTGVVSDPLNGLLDRLAGHGTFVAGVVRQRCAQAHLLDVPVMGPDGVVAESDVLLALGELLRLHLRREIPVRAETESVEQALDVVNLSMGYYHESPDDPSAAAPLAAVLRSLADAGVAVVAAAGNGATSTPFFPAGLSGRLPGPPPLVSVGALNPDDRTVAAFSNNGDWVTAHAPGAGVVSTVPVTLTGSRGRWLEVDRDDPLTRGTADPDDFGSGFATWSGTSFAAPWVAGDIAAGTAESGSVADAVEKVLAERRAHHAATGRRTDREDDPQ
ncbi:S8 family serine peptidase [Nesterenkonia suensis]